MLARAEILKVKKNKYLQNVAKNYTIHKSSPLYCNMFVLFWELKTKDTVNKPLLTA